MNDILSMKNRTEISLKRLLGHASARLKNDLKRYESTRPLDRTDPSHRRDYDFSQIRPIKTMWMTEMQYLMELDFYERQRQINSLKRMLDGIN